MEAYNMLPAHVESARRRVLEFKSHVTQTLENMVALLLEVALQCQAILLHTLVI